MIEADITKALQTAVIDAVSGAIPVKAIGMTEGTFSDKYVEIVQIINNRQNEYWGSERTYQGVLRVILHWPNDAAGPMPAKRYLDQLAAAMHKGRTLTYGAATVRLYDVPSAQSVIEDGAGLLFPLSIPYRAFRP